MRRSVRLAGRAARPVAGVARAAQRTARLTLVGWHRVDDSGERAGTPVDVFKRQLDLLQGSGSPVLPLDEAVRGLATGGLPAGATVLTFDDGYASVLETAWPLLHERGLPATLFVVSGYLSGGRRFPWDGPGPADGPARIATGAEVRAAAQAGLDIGSHTVTHPWLPHLDQPALERELCASQAALTELLGRQVTSVAYPMGGWNERVRRAAAAAGYTTGVTVDRGTSARGRDPLALRRTFAPRTVADFELVLAGAYTWLRPADRWRTRSGPAW